MPAQPSVDRSELRRRLLAERSAFAATPAFQAAEAVLCAALAALLEQLEPELLGVYWPMKGEFDPGSLPLPRALPFARREPAEMVFRRWDGQPPAARDDCGIATSTGAVAVPDVVGRSEGAARNDITGQGLEVGNVSTDTSAADPDKAGTVKSTNPRGGTQVTPGTVVDLVLWCDVRSVTVTPDPENPEATEQQFECR